MTDNNGTLRTATISTDEYKALLSEANSLRERIGSADESNKRLEREIATLKEKQPLVKVIHYEEKTNREYNYDRNDWDEYHYKDVKHTEFINLSDVTSMVTNQIKKETENENQSLKNKVRSLKLELEYAEDTEGRIERELNKELSKRTSELEDVKEQHEEKIKDLNKAYKVDVSNYKETIKDLKDEVIKVKDSKTDVEVEEKRNKEIKDLKARIKDLEKLVEELGSMNFIKRTFKLRKLSAEKLAAHKELLERERNANSIGTTWVKNGEHKYYKYGAFDELNNWFNVKTQEA